MKEKNTIVEMFIIVKINVTILKNLKDVKKYALENMDIMIYIYVMGNIIAQRIVI